MGSAFLPSRYLPLRPGAVYDEGDLKLLEYGRRDSCPSASVRVEAEDSRSSSRSDRDGVRTVPAAFGGRVDVIRHNLKEESQVACLPLLLIVLTIHHCQVYMPGWVVK